MCERERARQSACLGSEGMSRGSSACMSACAPVCVCVCVCAYRFVVMACVCVSVYKCVPASLHGTAQTRRALAVPKCHSVLCRLPGSASRLSEHANLTRSHAESEIDADLLTPYPDYHNSRPYYARLILEIANPITVIAEVWEVPLSAVRHDITTKR